MQLAAPSRAPSVAQWVEQFIKNRFRTVLKRTGFDSVDLCYIDNPAMAMAADASRARTLVYRAPDHFAGFGRNSELSEQGDNYLTNNADLIVCSSLKLTEHYRQLHQNVLYLPNGWADSGVTSLAANTERSGIVYVGATEGWLDQEFIVELARALPEQIVDIWGSTAEIPAFRSVENIRVRGVIAHNQLHELLQGYEYGLIPFDRDYNHSFVDSIHPLKLYEYLRAGLQVISTRFYEIENVLAPVLLTDSGAGAADFIRQHDGFDRDTIEVFLEGSTWEKRMRTFQEGLNGIA